MIKLICTPALMLARAAMRVPVIQFVLMALPMSASATASIKHQSTFDVMLGKASQNIHFNTTNPATNQTVGQIGILEQNLTLSIRGSYVLYNHTRNSLHVEAAYHQFQAISENGETVIIEDEETIIQRQIKTRNVELGLRYELALSQDFSFNAHLGAARVNMRLNGINIANSTAKDITQITPYYGLSLHYHLSQDDTVGIEYKRIELDDQVDNLMTENKIKHIYLVFRTRY